MNKPMNRYAYEQKEKKIVQEIMRETRNERFLF